MKEMDLEGETKNLSWGIADQCSFRKFGNWLGVNVNLILVAFAGFP